MPNNDKRYTLLWIPKSGLFFEGGEFLDGKRERIKWDRTIHIFASHARAETAKKRILEKFPDAQGELVMLPVEIQEIGGIDHEVSGQFDSAFSEEN
jgi:hypothetical protein